LDDYKKGDLILDRYEVTDTLGKGGMGYVLAAEDRRLGRLVALKFLLASLRDRAPVVARFEREARTATLIVDEHVARVHTVEVTPDGVPFIVMEHLRGKDLAGVIRERGPMPIAESVDLLLQSCEALAQAHKLGIVHRDLKPSNLFLTTTFDGTPILKVLDFGISKALGDDTSLTSTGAFVGSPAYMSPEQLSAGEVDARSDVWSLGVILYEMLAAVRPFQGDSVPMVCAAILEGRYADLSTHRPEISPAFEDALSEALAIDADWRFPGVEAFAAKLAPFGTDGARASYARIRRIASTTDSPAVAPIAPPNPATPLVELGATSADGPTSLTQDHRQPPPRPRPRRMLQAALGAAATAAIVLGFVRVRATPTPSSDAAPAPGSARPEPAPSGTADTSGCRGGATPACEAACATHQPGSCHELATALAKGVGAPQDLARAATLYKNDCDAGSADSCNELARLYALGEGVARDAGKAFALYDKACRGGSAAACANRGAMHFEGIGVPKDESAAAPLFLQGCEQGEPLACLNVSVAYREGRGVPKDLERAYEFAGRACTGGALVGCTSVGAAKVLGEGAAKDVKGGLAQLDTLCKRGETSACDKVAGFYAKGVGTDVPADSLRVREAVKKGCAAGSGRDCQAQKTLDTVDSTSAAPARGMALFQTKCDTGMMSACGMLGESLLSGSRGTVDQAKGRALLEKACKGGYAPACKTPTGAGAREAPRATPQLAPAAP